jgi:hypothetical protein
VSFYLLQAYNGEVLRYALCGVFAGCILFAIDGATQRSIGLGEGLSCVYETQRKMFKNET